MTGFPVRAIVERQASLPRHPGGAMPLKKGSPRCSRQALSADDFNTLVETWRANHLTKTALARQALIAGGALSASGAVQINSRMEKRGHYPLVRPALSLKAVIEQFATLSEGNPMCSGCLGPATKLLPR